MGLRIGQRVAGYRVERLLGAGALAEVYLVRQGERALALKVLSVTSPEIRARARREGALQGMLRHPNVVRVEAALEVNRQPALLMEHVDGPDLARLLAGGPLGDAQLEHIARGVLAGVAAIHDAGLAHRDLKPANILLALTGGAPTPRIADFGLARALEGGGEPALTRTGAVLGTPAYMAPEQLRDARRADARADVWALGCVLYELVTGRPAFGGGDIGALFQQILAGGWAPPRRLRPALPARWEAAIHAALQQDPGERPPDALALAAIWQGDVGPPEVSDGWDEGALRQAAEGLPLPGGETFIDEPPPPAPARHHNLPLERDAFVGRQEELAALAARLEAGGRLITVLGPGGAGKTRLVTRFGRDAAGRWPGGVWLCDLSEARDEAGVLGAVARALGLVSGSDPARQIGDALAGRGGALLLLDNFEQVVGCAEATVGRWLERAGRAAFVVTSRARLGIPGEQLLPLGPLPLPEGDELGALAENPAAALFAARAWEARPDFALGEDNAADVAALVRMLEGLPLAIELAAARSRVFSPRALLERMGQRLRLLTSRSRAGRHSTLRATLDWSWELLGDAERGALAQLGVFEGPFTLEAAAAALDLSPWGDDPAAPWPEDAVEALVDQCLVRSLGDGPGGEPRFGLFAAIREYAREKLVMPGAVRGGGGRPWSGPETAAQAERRHGAWFARIGRRSHRLGDIGPDPAGLAESLGDLSAAVDRAAAAGDGEIAAGAAHAALWVLACHGPADAGVALADRALAVARDPGDRARLLVRRGRLQNLRRHLDEAEGSFRQALEAGCEEPEVLRQALCDLGRVALIAGRLGEARAAFTRAEAVARGDGSPWGLGEVSESLGRLCRQEGRFEEARAHLEEALAHYRPLGPCDGLGLTLNTLGGLCEEQHRLDEAWECFEASVEVYRRLGNRSSEALSLSNLGAVAFRQRRSEACRRHLERALQLSRWSGARRVEANTCFRLGSLERYLGRRAEASALLEQAAAAAAEMGDPRLASVSAGLMGRIAWEEGRLGRALELTRRALALIEAAAEPITEVQTLLNLANVELDAGQPEEAAGRVERALPVALRLGNRFLYRHGQLVLGRALRARGGDRGAAEAALDRAIALGREEGDPHAVGLARSLRGEWRLEDGALEAAGEELEAAAGLVRAEDVEAAATLTLRRGRLALAQGDRAGARAAGEAALATLTGRGLPPECPPGRRCQALLRELER
jgi:predicted ATPase/tetratricopeptide (TPR) repeat protein